jgi:hypothetical protein
VGALAFVVLALVFGFVAASVAWQAERCPATGWFWWFLATSVVALGALAARFARATLRVVAVIIVVLGFVAVIGLGRAQLNHEQVQHARELKQRLKTELKQVLRSAPPSTAEATTDAFTSLETEIKKKAETSRADHEEIAAVLDDLGTALSTANKSVQGTASSLETIRELEQDPRLETEDAARAARVGEVRELIAQAIASLVLGGPTQVEEAQSTLRVLSSRIREDDVTAGALAIAAARAERNVARVIVDQTSATPDSAEAKAATAALVEADKKYLAALEDGNAGPDRSIGDLLSAGGRALVSDISPESVPVSLELAGWIIVAALVLLLYRALETRNGRGELILASVALAGKKPGEDDDQASLERFRSYLARNIQEPSAVPGASSNLKPITDVLDASKDAPAGWVSKLLTAVAALLNSPRGAHVSLTVLPVKEAEKTATAPAAAAPATTPPGAAAATPPVPAAPSPEAGADAATAAEEKQLATVIVRVTPPGAKHQVQEIVHGASAEAALREGAYWAAACLIEGSRRIPAWTVWERPAAKSLARYYEEVDTGREVKIESLQAAVVAAPRSGLLLVDLGHRYSIEESMVDAFSVYLQAALLYQDWPVARYRLAAAATMLAADPTAWPSAEPGAREAVSDVLKRRGTEKSKRLAAAIGNDRTDPRVALCEFAQELLDTDKLVGTGWVLWRTLRRTERSYWLAMLRSKNHITFRSQFEVLAQSAAEVARIRGKPARDSSDELNQGLTEANDKEPGLTWQLAYNLACAHAELARYSDASAQKSEIETALALLELAVTRPGGHQLNAEWLKKDPDLVSLHGEPRFERLIALLATTPAPS